MSQKHYPQERTHYPPAHGWLTFTNNREVSLYLQLMPSGAGCKMLPGETYHVHTVADSRNLPQVVTTEFVIVVYSADAIYHKGQEVHDFSETPQRGSA